MVVDEHGLASELEVWVRVVSAVAPTTPRPRLLLGDAEHHHPAAILPLGLLHVLARDVLLDIGLGEPHHRDVVGLRERLISSTYAAPIFPRIAGDGIVPPARSLRNLTSFPSDCNRGTYPARKIRSTDRTRSET